MSSSSEEEEEVFEEEEDEEEGGEGEGEGEGEGDEGGGEDGGDDKQGDGEEDQEDEDAEDEDEDEEEEEEEEEEERRSKKHKRSHKSSSRSKSKKKRRAGAQFVDLDAEEDSEDSESDPGEELNKEQYRREMEKQAAKLNRPRTEFVPMGMDEEEAEDFVRRNYEEDQEEYIGSDEEIDERAQGSQLPTIQDPRLWMVKCAQGHQRELACSVMRKFLAREGTEDPLLIFSVVCADHFKEHFYIEAHKKPHVDEALKGLSGVFRFKVSQVPLKEMIAVLAPANDNVQMIQEGGWVRCKRGTYNGDLAQVASVDYNRQMVTVRLIPRIEYDKDKIPTGRGIRRPKPSANLFSPELAKDCQDKRDGRGEAYYLFQGMKFKDGFLLKEMAMKSLVLNDVAPSIEEIQRFQVTKREEDDDDEADPQNDFVLPIPTTKRHVKYEPGDVVFVIKGDLNNLRAVVHTVNEFDRTLEIDVQQEGVPMMPVEMDHVVKCFELGDHVKVTEGEHSGISGHVMKVDKSVVILVSDVTNEEIKVFASALQLSAEVSSGFDTLGQFELHDMVYLDGGGHGPNQAVVGVIIKIDREQLTVLDNLDQIQRVKLQEIKPKRKGSKPVALDKGQNSITEQDFLKVVDGNHQGKSGKAMHLHRSFVFLHSKNLITNTGVFCVRARQCMLVGASRKQVDTPTLGRMGSPSVLRSPGIHRNAPPAHAQGGGGGRGRGRGTPKPRPCKITSGPWKGHQGLMLDSTETTARVDLVASNKIVNVPATALKMLDNESPSSTPGSNATPGRDYDEQGSRTPNYGGRTPLYMQDSSATPAHDPAWAIDTPSHQPSYNEYSVPTPDNSYLHTPYSPAYAPTPSLEQGTPGLPGTPGMPPTPGQPGTPGGVPPTPASPLETPHIGTPADMGFGTPYTPTMSSFTPGQTPMMETPYTPAHPETPSNAHMDPDTPGAADAAVQDNERFVTDMEVVFRSGPHAGKKGVVRAVNAGSCRVYLLQDGVQVDDEMTVLFDELQPSPPQKKKDRIKIISGEFLGNTGTLIGIDQEDGIVKMDTNLDIKILDMGILAKFVPRPQDPPRP